MTRWAMDDQFLGHHKTKRAMRVGLEALLMWFALRTYVSINLTDGFIPDEDIDDLPHAPKSPRRWLQVLVECGKPLPDGSRGPGLVDQVVNGWMLHDYEHHGELKNVIDARRASNRDRQKNLRERKSKQPAKDATAGATNGGSHGGSHAGTNGATNAGSNGVSHGGTDSVTHGGSNGPLSSSSSSSSSVPDPEDPTEASPQDLTGTQSGDPDPERAIVVFGAKRREKGKRPDVRQSLFTGKVAADDAIIHPAFAEYATDLGLSEVEFADCVVDWRSKVEASRLDRLGSTLLRFIESRAERKSKGQNGSNPDQPAKSGVIEIDENGEVIAAAGSR